MAEQEHNWWESVDADYIANLEKWQYTWEVYGSDPANLRSPKYLIQKTAGEHPDNYKERMALANFVPLLASVVDAYVGRLSESEKKITREFGQLGETSDADTLAGRIWRNADGNGTNYVPMLSQVATCLIAKGEVWGFVDGIRTDSEGRDIGGPTIRWIHPDAVPITVKDKGGNLVAAVVKHLHESRPSPFEPNTVAERYTVYTLDGHMTFEIQEKEGEDGKNRDHAVRVDGGEGEKPIPYGDNGFSFYDSPIRSREDRILPIFRVKLPTDHNPSYALACQNISYFNTYSELQNKHRNCNVIRAAIPYATDEDKDETEDDIGEGGVIWWFPSDSRHKPGFAEPSASSLSETRQWLSVMRGDFLFSSFRGYEDSVKGAAKTATEDAQDAAHGEHSFLNVLVAALDEFETQAWKRIEQVGVRNSNPSTWFQFQVERKRDFKPMDEVEVATRLRQTYFGSDPIPIGPTGKANAAIKVAESDGLEYKENEVRSAVQASEDRRTQEADIFGEVGL